MAVPAPYANCSRYVTSASDWTPLLRLERAWHITRPAIRVKGFNLNWRVVVDGMCGAETIADGTIPTGDAQTIRIGTMPEVLAGSILRVDVQLVSSISAQNVSAEISWVPAESGRGPGELG